MILLALGSNLGNREQFLADARMALAIHDVELMRVSSICETPALVPQGAPPEWNTAYLNQVIVVETQLPPRALLTLVKHIESDLGRKPTARWAPREIDIDVLAYHDLLVIEEDLVIPHPGMDERRFVLEPLAEIAPQWIHPVLGLTAPQMLEKLSG